MQIYDRIDLKAVGAWVNGFRPNGLTLSFSKNIVGGKVYNSLTNVTLPIGTSVREVVVLEQRFSNYVCSVNPPVDNTTGAVITDAAQVGNAMRFGSLCIITDVTFPAGARLNEFMVDRLGGPTVMPQTFSSTTSFSGQYKFQLAGSTTDTAGYLPFGTIVTGNVPSSKTPAGELSLALSLPGAFITANGIQFSPSVELMDVYIPFGVVFQTEMYIGATTFPAGVYKPDANDIFDMETIQLLTKTKGVVFSVHGVSSDELIAFNKPVVGQVLDRLVMYKDGVGINTDIFACYLIAFRVNVTAAMIAAFNAVHPSDANPIVVDLGSVTNPDIIFPQ